MQPIEVCNSRSRSNILIWAEFQPPHNINRLFLRIGVPRLKRPGGHTLDRDARAAPRRGCLLAAYRNVPGLAAVTEFAYGVIARHRTAASAVTSALWGKSVERPSYRLSNTLFLRLLGLCYLAAFLSLWVQVDGLIGSRGIMPARDLLEAARSQLGGERWTALPTLSWLNAGDGFLHFLCGAGTLAALLAAAGLVPAPALILCWISYLSLSNVGQPFLDFQWDLLLLETGFLGIWLAPVRRLRVGAALEPSPVVRARARGPPR